MHACMTDNSSILVPSSTVLNSAAMGSSREGVPLKDVQEGQGACCVQIQEVKGMRCWVAGSVKSHPSGMLLCSCTAQLVDLQQLWAAKR